MFGSVNPVYKEEFTHQEKLSDISDEEFYSVWGDYKYNIKQRIYQAICFFVFLTPIRIVVGILYSISYLLFGDILFLIGRILRIPKKSVQDFAIILGQKLTRGTLYFLGVMWIHEKGVYHKDCRFIIANHTAILDPIVLLSHVKFSPIIKAECEEVWYLRDNFSVVDPVFVKRDRARGQTQELIKRANDSSRNPILIFPEGTIPGDDYLLKFHRSAFLTEHKVQPVVIKYHMPLVPEGLNFYRWKKGISIYEHFFLMACLPPSYVTIEWLDPISLDTTGNGDIETYAEKAQLIMANKLGIKAITRSSNELFKNINELRERKEAEKKGKGEKQKAE
jgi:lysophosphatidylcholine acyltransferase/lyso-PAF acetyltransferase